MARQAVFNVHQSVPGNRPSSHGHHYHPPQDLSTNDDDHQSISNVSDCMTLTVGSDPENAISLARTPSSNENAEELAELDALATQINLMRAEVARLRVQAGERQECENPMVDLDRHIAYGTPRRAPSSTIAVPSSSPAPEVNGNHNWKSLVNSAQDLKSNKTTLKSRQVDHIPRFALPTAATLRRNNETLRRADAAAHAIDSSQRASHSITASNSAATGTGPASHLPKRTSLPTTWLTPESLPRTGDSRVGPGEKSVSPKEQTMTSTKHDHHSSSIPSPKKKQKTYMSPTEATSLKSIDMIGNPSSSEKFKKKPNKFGTPGEFAERLKSMALAMEAVSAASRSLSMTMNPPEPMAAIRHTTTIRRRRTTNSHILSPIFRKLERQGLLKSEVVDRLLAGTNQQSSSAVAGVGQDSVDKDENSHFKQVKSRLKTYSDILNASHRSLSSSARDQRPCDTVKETTSSTEAEDTSSARSLCFPKLENVEKVAASQTALPSSPLDDLDSSPPIVNKLIVETESVSELEERSFFEPGVTTSNGNLHGNTDSAVDGQDNIFSPDTRQTPSKSQCSTLNARALDFTPVQNRLRDPQVFENVSYQWTPTVGVDVLRKRPDDEWYSLTPYQRSVIKDARLHKYRQSQYYNSPWASRKQALHSDTQSGTGVESMLSPSTRSAASWNSQYTPDHHTGQQRRGWQVSSEHSGNTLWLGGNGKEIRFVGHAPAAEHTGADTFLYRNDENGTNAHFQQPGYTYNMPMYGDSRDTSAKLEAAMMRGYPKVPCDNYEWSPAGFAMLPGYCDSCMHGQHGHAVPDMTGLTG